MVRRTVRAPIVMDIYARAYVVRRIVHPHSIFAAVSSSLAPLLRAAGGFRCILFLSYHISSAKLLPARRPASDASCIRATCIILLYQLLLLPGRAASLCLLFILLKILSLTTVRWLLPRRFTNLSSHPPRQARLASAPPLCLSRSGTQDQVL